MLTSNVFTIVAVQKLDHVAGLPQYHLIVAPILL
jgi:hypothetical protein